MDNLNSSRETELIKQIKGFADTGMPAKTKLETDQKVLARVTDGIYRFPGSALRELISNSYDADAENVYIDTDVPRFESMSIRDDGNGMSIETLVNLINHIGASAKRSNKGTELEVTDSSDPTVSKNKKRKLIGKIGIGLFSVAQLTRDFEIITKEKGKGYYLRAVIKLHNYSEEYINKIEADTSSERGASFETGSVEIWTEPTENLTAHGTDILLKNIKKSARDQLKSLDIWGQEKAQGESFDEEDILNSSKLDKPEFHIGFSTENDVGDEQYSEKQEKLPCYPWDNSVDTEEKFKILYEKIIGLTKKTTNPKLNIVFDNYFNMIWTLALSVPLDYLEKHPFSYTHKEVSNVFAISNKIKGQVASVNPSGDKCFSEICGLKTSTKPTDFNVVVDGVKLYRPIKFTGLPKSDAAVKEPILFLGSYTQKFDGLSLTDSGGEISFDAFILWAPKIIPKDHNGVLVRLHNASGILFDETFMKHQVAEHTIKSQLVAEIFVNKGLDSALNIDRESFNISHPHYQVIMTWLHQAIRQVVNKYKALKQSAVQARKELVENEFSRELIKIAENSMQNRGLDTDAQPSLYLIDSDKAYSSRKGNSALSELPVEAVRFDKSKFNNLTGTSSKKFKTVEAKTEALIQILDSYGLLSDLSPNALENLLEDIVKVLSFGE